MRCHTTNSRVRIDIAIDQSNSIVEYNRSNKIMTTATTTKMVAMAIMKNQTIEVTPSAIPASNTYNSKQHYRNQYSVNGAIPMVE